METYSGDNQGIYPSAVSHLTPYYLDKIPVCAASGEGSHHYEVSLDSHSYTWNKIVSNDDI